MIKLIAIKFVWLPKNTHKSMIRLYSVSHIAKMISIQLLFSIVTIHHWTLFQFDTRMPFYTVIVIWKYTWNNFLELLLRSSLIWYFIYEGSCMAYGISSTKVPVMASRNHCARFQHFWPVFQQSGMI